MEPATSSPQLDAGFARPSVGARLRVTGPGLIAVAGVAAAALSFAIVRSSDILLQPRLSAWVRAAIVLANVAGGAYTWWRRPASGFGPLFAFIGLAFALTSLNAFASPMAFTLGRVVFAGVMVALVYACLSFPSDRPGSHRDRRFMELFAAVSALVWVLVLVFAVELPPSGPFGACVAECPHNALQVIDGAAGAGRVFAVIASTVTATAFLAVAVLLLVRMRESDRAARRTLAPLFAGLSAVLVSLAAYIVAREAFDAHPTAVSVAVAASVVSLPVAMLAGQVRGRLFAARHLGRLVADVAGTPVTGADVQRLVCEALGDPGLTLARWDAAGEVYRELDGDVTVAADAVGDDRVRLELTRGGSPYALVRYDAALSAEVVRGVAAGGLMLLENVRLAAERGRLVEELRASRARMAAATHDSRVQIERDLHDGVQPHLNALLIKLGIARDVASDDEVAGLIEEVGDDAAAAVAALRTLARGIYPPLLRERGLAEALKAFAVTAPVAVRVDEHGHQAASPAATAAVYFTVLEAIQNAIKHGGDGVRIDVTLERRPDALAFVVADDGPGFDRRTTEAGVGMLSMEDRIGAVAGELEIRSSAGRGTTVSGWVPAVRV